MPKECRYLEIRVRMAGKALTGGNATRGPKMGKSWECSGYPVVLLENRLDGMGRMVIRGHTRTRRLEKNE